MRSTTLYVHLDATTGLVRAEQYGAMNLDLLGIWLGRTARIALRPVLDLNRGNTGTGTYRPPSSMREAVILRDPRCALPGCSRASRGCDLDHIDPFPRRRGAPDESDGRRERA